MRLAIMSAAAMCAFALSPVEAAYTIKDGKLIATHELATLSAQEHYSLMLDAEEKDQWDDLALQSNIVLKNFPDTPFADEAKYFLAVSLFHLGELELSNKQFSTYLKQPSAPKYFEEAVRYKFEIAQKFERGQRAHVLGLTSLPKWQPAKELAIEIYDEVITAFPHHELTVQSLFGKANLQLSLEEFASSIETYQIIIRKFNKHPLAVESYVGISNVYLKQCLAEYPDPDFLDLAEINYKKFTAEFPAEPRAALAFDSLKEMREIYAATLYDTAQFYERTKKPQASVIYYNKILAKYPNTHIASQSEDRLAYLETKLHRPLKDAQFSHPSEDQVVLEQKSDEITALLDTKESLNTNLNQDQTSLEDEIQGEQ